MNQEKIVYEKACEVMSKMIEFKEEHNCHTERAWDAIKIASKLTEEQMKECAVVAFMGHKII